MEDSLKDFGVTQRGLAVFIGVPPRRTNVIVNNKRRVTAHTVRRLGRSFSMEPQFRIKL